MVREDVDWICLLWRPQANFNILGLSSLICGMGILTFLPILREVTVQDCMYPHKPAPCSAAGKDSLPLRALDVHRLNYSMHRTPRGAATHFHCTTQIINHALLGAVTSLALPRSSQMQNGRLD